VVALGLLAAACGADYPAKPADLADPVLSDDCDAARAAQALSDVGITYDYEPSTSLGDMGDRLSDAVVKGRIVWRAPGERNERSLIVLSLRVDEVLDDQTGSVVVGDDLDFVVDYNPALVDYSAIHDSISPGMGVIVFIGSVLSVDYWNRALEGLWFACGGEDAFGAGVRPSWRFSGSLDELAAAIPPAIAEARAVAG
jgi:hypothetical protein